MAPKTHQFIAADWKQWIAENLLKRNDPEDLHRILCENGFDSELSRLEIETASQHPYLAAARSVGRQLEKRDWVLHTHRMLREVDGGNSVLESPKLSGEEFLKYHYRTRTPVVLKDCLNDWRGTTKWSREYFKKTCGELTVEVQSGRESNAEFERQPDRHRSSMQFSDLVDICFGENQTNDVYMTARNGQANGAVLDALWDDVGMLSDYLNPEMARSRYFLWFGPKGTITPLHHDLTNNFMAQIIGSKKIYLIAPEYQPYIYNHFHCYSKLDLCGVDRDEYPLFDHIEVLEVTIRPGDLLFLPVGWWHHVEGLETSATMTCTNFRWVNTFEDHYLTTGEI